MTMRRHSLWRAVSCVLFLHTACGSGDSGEGSFPVSCADGEFKIEGILAGQTVSVHGQAAGGGFWRINPAGFSSQASTMATDPTKTRLDLDWKDDFSKDRFPATGTLRMGTSGLLPGKEFCLGTGTVVDFSHEDLRFLLKDLTEGPDCTTPVVADLAGCWM